METPTPRRAKTLKSGVFKTVNLKATKKHHKSNKVQASGGNNLLKPESETKIGSATPRRKNKQEIAERIKIAQQAVKQEGAIINLRRGMESPVK